MNEDPINPYYMYDDASEEYLKESLKRKVFEADSYRRWTERAVEEVKYIQNVLESRKKK